MTATKRKVLNQFDRNRCVISFGDKTRTKQSFKKECDINFIMAKFHKNGIVDHLNNNAAQYGDLTGYEFSEAQLTIARANTMFEELPSLARKEFSGPAEFLDFVADAENGEKLVELGLATQRPESHDLPAAISDLRSAIKDLSEGSEKPKTPESDPESDPKRTVST